MFSSDPFRNIQVVGEGLVPSGSGISVIYDTVEAQEIHIKELLASMGIGALNSMVRRLSESEICGKCKYPYYTCYCK